DPLNRVTTYNYDNNDNLASVVDAEGNTTGYVYDERDLLFTVTDANTPAGVTTYDYDLNGNLGRVTDACLGWEDSEKLILEIAAGVREL
ncbi:MAG: hypothetical protein HZA28_06485, partial [Candidatus Omnitrophica bacterium]|nr:hypothetical protein [Candidatus Omnitrophota bacterium]